MLKSLNDVVALDTMGIVVRAERYARTEDRVGSSMMVCVVYVSRKFKTDGR